MDKHKYRLPTTLAALAVVLAISLYLQFSTNPEQHPQVSERHEGTAIPKVPEGLAPEERPIPAQIPSSDKGGLFATAEWRNRRGLSDEVYPRTYAELRALAEKGDVEATRRLVGLVSSCEHAALPMSEAELSEIVAEMRASYTLPKLTDGQFEFLSETTGQLTNYFESASEFDSFVDEWHSNTKTCTAVTLEQRQEADYWLGVLEAQGGGPVSTYKSMQGMDHDEKIAYVDSMWATGDPYALAEYAQIYGDHELQLIDPSARVKSYAYIYAFYEAMIETAKYHSDADALARLRYSLKRIRKNYSVLLSEYELREAHELTRQIIAANENCCTRLSPSLYK